MTPRETVIEAMAKAVCDTFRMPSDKHTDCFSWADLLEEERDAFRATARTHLDALLAALPGLGLKVVPVEATPDMNIAGGLAWSAELPNSETYVDCAHACYAAMLAAAPDPLGGGE